MTRRAIARRCICGCGARRVQFHHAVYQQQLRKVVREEHRKAGGLGPPDVIREMTLVNDSRNLVPVGPKCHAAHHGRSRVLALRMLPDSVFEFAAEVLGAGAAYEYLRRRYEGEDERLDALLSE